MPVWIQLNLEEQVDQSPAPAATPQTAESCAALGDIKSLMRDILNAKISTIAEAITKDSESAAPKNTVENASDSAGPSSSPAAVGDSSSLKRSASSTTASPPEAKQSRLNVSVRGSMSEPAVAPMSTTTNAAMPSAFSTSAAGRPYQLLREYN